MSSFSIVQLKKTCKPPLAGISKLYLIAFRDLVNLYGTDQVYSLNEDGIVNNIGFAYQKNFVEVGLLRKTASVTQSLQRINQANKFFNHSLNFSIAELNNTNRTFLMTILNTPLVAMFKLFDGKYWVIGLDGNLELKELTGSTGINFNDFNGYVLKFTGFNKNSIQQIDFNVISPAEYFNYSFEIAPGNNGETETTFSFDNPI